VYAESILKVCEFCVGSPLACVAGVTGADLKKRMVHIMSEHVVRKLNFSKKLFITAVAAAAIAAPILFGLMHATPVQARVASDDAPAGATYTSVSIKPSAAASTDNQHRVVHSVRMMRGPDGFKAENITLRAVIEEAYGLQANQVIGGPDWLGTAAYDITVGRPSSLAAPTYESDVKTSRPDIVHDRVLQDGEHRQMLQSLLADHAGLVAHHETRNLPTYALTIAEGGSKLQPTKSKGITIDLQGPHPDSGDAEVQPGDGQKMKIMTDHHMMMNTSGEKEMSISAVGIPADDLAHELSRLLGMPVTNQTGLKGSYDFKLHWARSANGPGDDAASTTPDHAALVNAVEEQLGLKLTPQNVTAGVLVIDHIEKPAEN
jgi:uncharacterized protein (TIGR03435 family)